MERLAVVLIPIGHEYLILPQAMLNHIYPYALPLSVDQSSEFVVGGVFIQNAKLPLLDFAFSPSPDDSESGWYLVLAQTITTQSSYRTYAIVSHGEPRLLELSPEEITTLKAGDHRYIAQYVSIPYMPAENPVIVLDLEQLEQELSMS